jgi:hypothetical protein
MRSRLPHAVGLQAHLYSSIRDARFDNRVHLLQGLGATADTLVLGLIACVTPSCLTVPNPVSSFSVASCTTMAPPDMSDGLQIAQPETYPEAVHRYSMNTDTKLPQLRDQSHREMRETRVRPSHDRMSYDPGPRSVQSEFGATNIEVPVDLWKKIFDHRRRNFWIIVILAVVISGALIGGSIGGALVVQNKADAYVRLVLSMTTASVADATSRSAAASAASASAASVAAASVTASLGQASSTATSTSSSASSTSSAGNDQDNVATYAARPFGAIQSINATCPSTLLVSSQLEGKTSDISGRYRYNCLDNTNIPDLPNLVAFTAYSLEQCVDACSQYSAMNNSTSTTCKAAVINADFSQRYESANGANCWLKSGAGDASTGQPGYTAAVLQES